MNIVNGSELNSAQIDQLTELFFYTGYFELGSKDNLLNLPAKEFQRRVTVVPALNYIRAMLDEHDEVVGFHQCLTKAETKIFFESLPDYYAKTPDNLEILDLISKLYIEEPEDSDLIIHFRAIHEDMQGKGLFKVLMRDLIRLAKEKNCSRLFSATWAEKTKTIAIFKSYGAVERKVLDFSHTIYRDKLINFVTNVTDVEQKLK